MRSDVATPSKKGFFVSSCLRVAASVNSRKEGLPTLQECTSCTVYVIGREGRSAWFAVLEETGGSHPCARRSQAGLKKEQRTSVRRILLGVTRNIISSYALVCPDSSRSCANTQACIAGHVFFNPQMRLSWQRGFLSRHEPNSVHAFTNESYLYHRQTITKWGTFLCRYLVWSGASLFGGHVYNARFIVQSNDRSPEYLDQRVESFIAGFREVKTSFIPRLK